MIEGVPDKVVYYNALLLVYGIFNERNHFYYYNFTEFWVRMLRTNVCDVWECWRQAAPMQVDDEVNMIFV